MKTIPMYVLVDETSGWFIDAYSWLLHEYISREFIYDSKKYPLKRLMSWKNGTIPLHEFAIESNGTGEMYKALKPVLKQVNLRVTDVK